MSVKIALAGNPNSGKTTLFNALTGANQTVGNWPGVTVEKKSGRVKGFKDVILEDLPGIYSLSPYTQEEVISREYLIEEKPDVIINIIDGTNLERNLYLTTQVVELGIPVIIALNMVDVLEKRDEKIDTKALSKGMGCDVVEISALKGTGVKTLTDRAVKLAQKQTIQKASFSYDERLESAISEAEGRLENIVADQMKRYFAIKLLSKDSKISGEIKKDVDVSDIIERVEKDFDDDIESIVANERYEYISSIISGCYIKKNKEKLTVSDKIDKVVTNRIAALPIFAIIMCIVYYVSVSTVGSWATDWANDGLFGDGFHLFGIGDGSYAEAEAEWASEAVFTEELKEYVENAADSGDVIGADEVLDAIEEEDFGAFDEAYGTYADEFAEEGYGDIETILEINGAIDDEGEWACEADPADYGIWVPGIPVIVEGWLSAINCADWLSSLILDGIIAGVGAVLGFVPQMLILFLFLAFLEECGYMSRVAFIMDRIFRKFGLSGKSFISILIGTGCGIPGIMSSRTIENEKDRRMTVMTTTFIPCGAKLPIIAMISAALFDNTWWVGPSAYFLGIAAIIVSGIILKKTKMFAGDPAPFVMELPEYHLPTVGSVLRSVWERAWSFIKKAGTIILLSTIVIWVGSVFGWENGAFGFNPDMELDASILGHIGNGIKFIFAPLGFGDATASVATIMGLVAKEEVVGVFGVLDFEGMTKLAGYSFLIFNLLCAPCFAAMGAIKREMNNIKWFWFAIGYQCLFAYVIALCFYNIGMLFTGVFSFWTVVAILLLAGLIYLLVRPNKYDQMVKVSA